MYAVLIIGIIGMIVMIIVALPSYTYSINEEQNNIRELLYQRIEITSIEYTTTPTPGATIITIKNSGKNAIADPEAVLEVYQNGIRISKENRTMIVNEDKEQNIFNSEETASIIVIGYLSSGIYQYKVILDKSQAIDILEKQ